MQLFCKPDNFFAVNFQLVTYHWNIIFIAEILIRIAIRNFWNYQLFVVAADGYVSYINIRTIIRFCKVFSRVLHVVFMIAFISKKRRVNAYFCAFDIFTVFKENSSIFDFSLTISFFDKTFKPKKIEFYILQFLTL